MRTVIIIALMASPALAETTVYPTTNNRSNTTPGDINGNITGDLGTGSDQNQTRENRRRYGCSTDRNGRAKCR